MIAPDDQIHRLRVRGSPAAAPALRLRLTSLLSGTDLRPPEMPPAAVLVVRHLTDPLPGHLTPAAWRPTPAWEQAAQQALARWYRQAARPRQGFLPDAAPAVCFRSRAELLACLALDLSRGRAHRRWWWRAWLRSGATAEATVEAAWTAEAKHVPAALDLLATWREAASVLAPLTDSQVRAVLAAVAVAFDLPALLPAEDAPPKPAPARPTVPSPVPWSPSVTALLPPDLAPAPTALLGIGLTLHRQPARVRTAAFQTGVRQWWETPLPSRLPERTSPSPPAGDTRAASARPAASAAARPGAESTLPYAAPAPPVSHPGPASAAGALHPLRRPPPQVTHEIAQTPSAVRATPVLPNEPSAAASPSASPQPRPAASEPPSPVLPEDPAAAAPYAADSLTTQWGGVLYLINAMTRLDLPTCFGTPLAAVSRWTLLEALARGLLGTAFDALPPDPLWHSLALLDDRTPDEPLGADVAPMPFHLPAAWMGSLPAPDDVCWAAGRTRFSLWTSDGVILADGPRSELRPTARVEAELARLGLDPARIPRTRRPRRAFPAAPVAASAPSPMAPGLLAWTQQVVPAVRSILCGWLDRPVGALVETLLQHPGQLYLSSSHVDLVLPLNAISLPVRLAGLDRDPGWQPAFGRVILFHFD